MEITKSQLNHIRTWVNKAGIEDANLESFDWIKDNHKQIHEYIEDSYTNLNTKKSHINTLSQILKKLKKTKLYKDYSEEATNLNKKSVEIQEAQETKPDRIEDFVCFDDIVKRREELKKVFEKNSSEKNNLKYLMLALYTLQPPIRQEYREMEIVNKKPPKDENNYLWDRNGKYTVVINNDKVSKTYGRAEFPLSEELNKIIRTSLEEFPREWVLSLLRDGNRPLGKQNFERLMREIFDPKSVGVDLIRSAYITAHYNNPKFTLKDKKELAIKMRHSASIAEQAYRKLDVDCDGPNKPELPPLVVSLPAPKVEVESPKTKSTFDLKSYMKEYREKNKEKYKKLAKDYYQQNKYEIGRKKVLWNVNVAGNISKPSTASINKYNLKYDRESKQWV